MAGDGSQRLRTEASGRGWGPRSLRWRHAAAVRIYRYPHRPPTVPIDIYYRRTSKTAMAQLSLTVASHRHTNNQDKQQQIH